MSLYHRILLLFCSPPQSFTNRQWREEEWKSKTKGQKQKCKSALRFIFKLTYQMCFLSVLPRENSFHLVKLFSETPEFYNPWKLLKTRTYHQVHTWEIKCYHPFWLLPPPVWKMCAAASQQCEITPMGGQWKGIQAKNVTWISLNVPSFVMTLLHSTGTTHRNVFFFVVHYKLLLLMLFFVVMLRNNLVTFGVVVHAFSSTNNLLVSRNRSSYIFLTFSLTSFFLFFCLCCYWLFPLHEDRKHVPLCVFSFKVPLKKLEITKNKNARGWMEEMGKRKRDILSVFVADWVWLVWMSHCAWGVWRSHYIHKGSRGGSLFELCAFVLKFASSYHD